MTVLRAAAATHTGYVRATNQDLALVSRDLVAVADGMGGHLGGEVAARMAIEELLEAFQRDRTSSGLAKAVRRANRTVWKRSRVERTLHGMGTTLTAAALVAGSEKSARPHLVVVNIGDSRGYALDRSTHELQRLTEDHSVVEEMVRQGELTADEAAVHPHRHVLTRALGIDAEVELDVWDLEPAAGSRFLLCSDGLTNELSEREIGELLEAAAEPEDAARELVGRALGHGGTDNVTVVVVDVLDEAADAKDMRVALVPARAPRPEAPPGEARDITEAIPITPALVPAEPDGGSAAAVPTGAAPAVPDQPDDAPAAEITTVAAELAGQAGAAAAEITAAAQAGQHDEVPAAAAAGAAALPGQAGDGDTEAVPATAAGSAGQPDEMPAEGNRSRADSAQAPAEDTPGAANENGPDKGRGVVPVPADLSAELAGGDGAEGGVAAAAAAAGAAAAATVAAGGGSGTSGVLPSANGRDEPQATEAVPRIGDGERRRRGRSMTVRSASAPVADDGAGEPMASAQAAAAPVTAGLGTPSRPVVLVRRVKERGRDRIVTFRVALFVILIAAVAAGTAAVVIWFEQSSYYVGLDGSAVAIYQGRPHGVLWFKPRLLMDSNLTTSQVLPSAVVALKVGIMESTEKAAEQVVTNLANERGKLATGINLVPPTTGPPPTFAPPTTLPPTTSTTTPRHKRTTTTTGPSTTIPSTSTTRPRTTTTTTRPGTTTTTRPGKAASPPGPQKGRN